MVCFNNTISKVINVTSGVPQGSQLGPLLFGLMINDLPYVIQSSTVLMYAGDVKLCFSMCLPNSYNDLHLELDGDVDSPFLLSSLNCNVPCRKVRRYRPFSMPTCISKYIVFHARYFVYLPKSV